MSRAIIILTLVLQVIPRGLVAQAAPGNARAEVSGSAGWARMSRFDDSTPFGSGASIGGRLAVRPFDRLGVGVDLHGMRGLEESVTSAVVLSGAATYDLSRSARARPYILGGLGVLRTHNLASAGSGRPAGSRFTDVGWGPILGLGVRVVMAARVFLRPELTYIDAPWLSRMNLSETRGSIAVGYQW